MAMSWFRAKLKKECLKLGLTGNFNSHSLRIGAAKDAAKKGVTAYIIKSLGRWRSNAFKRYIIIPGGQLAEAVAWFAQA